jgi:hypothetical protein
VGVTLHFLHIGKTGGTAVKWGLRRAGWAAWPSDDDPVPQTRYGPILLHHHSFRLSDVPADDYAFFFLRDPVELFLSAFYSRLNKGQPRYYYEWTEGERRAFETFPTPQSLARALASSRAERRQAQAAMRQIRHLRGMRRILGDAEQLRARRRQIVYIGRQETLAEDWEQLKSRLGLPAEAKLPKGNVRANRRTAAQDPALDPDATEALRRWYRREYEILRYCESLRRLHGWGAGQARRSPLDRVRRLREMTALLPPEALAAQRRLRRLVPG